VWGRAKPDWMKNGTFFCFHSLAAYCKRSIVLLARP
jgi:hypothetical protein